MNGREFRIGVLVFDGADEIDFVAPVEIFGTVARERSGVEVALVTMDGKETVTGAHGLTVRPDGVFAEGADLVVVPGGGWVSESPRGVRAEIARGLLVKAIRDAHAAGAVIAGACTGAMALAAAGLLDGTSGDYASWRNSRSPAHEGAGG